MRTGRGDTASAGMGDHAAIWPSPTEAKQSITEVLHNPRGTLELREQLDFRAPPTPPAPPHASPDASLTINDFEQYLRELAPLYDEAPLSPVPLGSSSGREDVIAGVPKAYFEEEGAFRVAQSEDLAELGAPLDAEKVGRVRTRLSKREDALRVEMQHSLDERGASIAAALGDMRALRARVLATAAEVQVARDRSHAAVLAVARSVARIDDVVAARRNALAVLHTLRLVKRVRAASDDVRVLLDTGQYAAAIDAVHSARDALQGSTLRHVHALSAARARLARSVESIDARLREDFRTVTRTGADDNVDETQVLVVAELIARIGRMGVLQRTYLDDIGVALDAELAESYDMGQVCHLVRGRVCKAARVLRALFERDREADSVEKESDKELNLRGAMDKLYSIAQEAVVKVMERKLKTFPIGKNVSSDNLIVLLDEDKVSEISCFDEAKAAIRFAELMRSLNQLADDLARDLNVRSGAGGPLRAKCRERLLAFIDAFHEAHCDAVKSVVHSDDWQEVEAHKGVSRLVWSVTGSAPADDGEGDTRERRVAGPLKTPRAGTMKGKRSLTLAPVPKKQRVPLVMNGQSYYAVRSGLRFARSLCAYALVVDKIPLVSSAAARRGVDLSILFNRLVCEAILGAAALEWAGIKTITARHLALASRTVAMAGVLSTAVHDILQASLSENQKGVVIPHMKRTQTEFLDSQSQLLAKILTIMMQRLAAHEKTLKALPWAKKAEMSRMDIPSHYIVHLSRESGVLHRILWSILPKQEVGDIFGRVCVSFSARLAGSYDAIEAKDSSWVKKRVMADTSHLYRKLAELDVFDGNAEALKPVETLFKDFSIATSKVSEKAQEKESASEESKPKNTLSKQLEETNSKTDKVAEDANGKSKEIRESTEPKNEAEPQQSKSLNVEDSNLAEEKSTPPVNLAQSNWNDPVADNRKEQQASDSSLGSVANVTMEDGSSKDALKEGIGQESFVKTKNKEAETENGSQLDAKSGTCDSESKEIENVEQIVKLPREESTHKMNYIENDTHLASGDESNQGIVENKKDEGEIEAISGEEEMQIADAAVISNKIEAAMEEADMANIKVVSSIEDECVNDGERSNGNGESANVSETQAVENADDAVTNKVYADGDAQTAMIKSEDAAQND